MVTSAKATTGDIINENFSGFTGIAANSIVWERNHWKVCGCAFLDNSTFNKALSFSNENIPSYAETPEFTNIASVCNATITFRYANQSANNSSFSITINGDGTFPNGKKKYSETINTGSAVFNDAAFKLIGISSSTSITFKLKSTKNYYFVLDDVIISTADQVTLNESAANSLVTKVADVTVGRTLAADVWNTLCLPFGVGKNTIAQATGNAVDGVSLRTFSGFSEDVLTFAAVDTVTAGTPFLVKLAQAAESPTFPLVDLKGNITAETRTVTYNGASMIGIFDQTDIGSSGLFLTASGELKRASGSSTTLKGLRAYFTVPGPSARLVLDDGATVIDMVETAPADNRWYAPDGRRYNTQPTRRGIYIKDGKKVIIR